MFLGLAKMSKMDMFDLRAKNNLVQACARVGRVVTAARALLLVIRWQAGIGHGTGGPQT